MDELIRIFYANRDPQRAVGIDSLQSPGIRSITIILDEGKHEYFLHKAQ